MVLCTLCREMSAIIDHLETHKISNSKAQKRALEEAFYGPPPQSSQSFLVEDDSQEKPDAAAILYKRQ
jgi:hypothetical protein